MKAISNNITRDLAIIPDAGLNTESRLLRDTCDTLLYRAMGTLDGKEKHLVILRGWFGCSFYEIAVMEHVSVRSARMNYARLVKQLKAEIMSCFISVNHVYKKQVSWELS